MLLNFFNLISPTVLAALNFFNPISPTVLATLNFFNPISPTVLVTLNFFNPISPTVLVTLNFFNLISEPSEMLLNYFNLISEPSEMLLNYFNPISRTLGNAFELFQSYFRTLGNVSALFQRLFPKTKRHRADLRPCVSLHFYMFPYLLFCKTSSTLPSASTSCISSAFAPAFTALTAFIDCRIFVSKSISGHAIMVVAACAIVSADASLLSNVTEVLKILQPAFPCSLFSFISNSMKGVFSDCTFSPFTSTTFHFPSSCLASVFEPEQANRLPANTGTNKAYIKNFFISHSFY